jgi:hypothetical protein
MALKSWLASLKADVSNVSGVQANAHEGLGRYVTDTVDVSGVLGLGGMVARDTADTAGNMQAYQAQPSWALACTGDTADTGKKTNTEAHVVNELSTGDLLTAEPTEPKRLFRQRGPWLTCGEHSAAQAYHTHHFNCKTCIAAGWGISYGRRCKVGLALWNTYLRG